MRREHIAVTSCIGLALVLSSCTQPDPDDSAIESGLVCDTASWEDTGIQVGDIDGACRCEEPTVEIGTGDVGFVEVDASAELQMIHGPQGGWHVPGAVRLTNFRDVVELLAWVTLDGEPVTEQLTYRVLLVSGDACTGTFPNMYLYLDVSGIAEGELNTPPELLACKDVVVNMCGSDTGGREVCSEISVKLLPDPSDVESGLAEDCAP